MELSGNVNNLSGDAAIAYLHAQEEIRRARSKRRWIAAGAVLVALFVLMVGCSALVVGAAASDGTASRATSAPTASAAPSLAPAAPAPVAPSAAPTAPAGTYGAGTYRLGNDIAPGDYVTDGPTGASDFSTWSRLSDTSGDYTAIIASGIVEGPTTITVKSTDAAVHFTGHATWHAA
jgi:hypothetical protein